jgi:hypothetical protein
MESRDKLGRFLKGQKCPNWNGFKKGNHVKTEFKGGYHPPTEFKRGHRLSIGSDNGRYIDGRSYTRRDLSNPKKF